MKQAQRYKYPLQPPQSLKQTAVRAVAWQIGAVETAAALLKARRHGEAGRSEPLFGACAGCFTAAVRCHR